LEAQEAASRKSSEEQEAIKVQEAAATKAAEEKAVLKAQEEDDNITSLEVDKASEEKASLQKN